jgi:hypothetical protein
LAGSENLAAHRRSTSRFDPAQLVDGIERFADTYPDLQATLKVR